MGPGARRPRKGARRGAFASARGTRAAAVAATVALVAAGCGGPARQDIDERKRSYRVEVTEAKFPNNQKLAKSSRMTIAVRNVDTKEIPQIVVTVGTGVGNPSASEGPAGFTYRDPDNEDTAKPLFIVDTSPRGGETAYKDTWALGKLKPGQTKRFMWDLTAVEARPYKIRWRVSAGLDGNGKAILADGQQPQGEFAGVVSDEAPDAKVADSGSDIIRGGEVVTPRTPGN